MHALAATRRARDDLRRIVKDGADWMRWVAVAFAVPMAMAAAPIHRLSVEQVDGLLEAGLLEDRRMELVDGILIVVHREPVDGACTKVTRRSDGALHVPGGGTPVDVGALLTAAG